MARHQLEVTLVQIQQRFPQRFAHVDDLSSGRVQIVRDEEHLRRMVNELWQAREFSCDTETSGLAWAKHARICGHVFGYRAAPGLVRNWYVPIRHLANEQQLAPELVTAHVKPLLESQHQTKILHNRIFDHHMYRMDGINLSGPLRDTMVEAHLMNENMLVGLKERMATDLGDHHAFAYDRAVRQRVHSLAKTCGLGKTEYTDLFGYSHIEVNLAGTYGCYDTESCIRLGEFYDQHRIRETYASTYDVEMRVQNPIIEMEKNGLVVDVDYLHNVGELTHREEERLEPLIYNFVGRTFNIGSDADLREVLQGDLRLRLWRTTDSGEEYSVDSETLKQLMPDCPQLEFVIKWREANKIRTTYTQSIIDKIGHDGLLHGQLKQLGTKTGRLSSANPNLQNFAGDSSDRKKANDGVDPWSIKRAFVNRGPGYLRGFFDYSQIEMRVLAHYSQDPVLREVYANDGDIHERVRVETGLEERRQAKEIVFGLNYMMSAGGLAPRIGKTRDEAQVYLDRFFANFPRIKPFRDEFFAQCRKDGCQFRDMFGRPRRNPKLMAQDSYTRGSAERAMIGSFIQGSAAHLTKVSMIRIHEWELANRAGIILCSTVHDEIQGDFHKATFASVAREVKRMMEDFPELSILPKVDAETSETSWADKAEYVVHA